MGNLAGEYGNPVTAPCTTCYVSVDQLGSTRMLTDAQGNVKERHDYMPFGDELLAGVDGRTNGEGYLSSGSTPGTSVLFTGQYRDTELANSQMPSGLDYFRGRHYAPAFGRFMQSDPVGNLVATTGAPQSWHLYGYGRNNPFAFIDPSGLCSQDSSGNFQDSDDGATFWFSGPCNSGQIGGSDPYTITVDGGTLPPVPFDDCPVCMALLGPGFGVPASDGGSQPSSSGALQSARSNFVHNAMCSLASPLLGAASATKGTVGVGAGGSFGALFFFGGSVSLGVQVVADPSGNLGIAINSNPGFTGFGVSAMGGGRVSVSTSKSIFGLAGWSFSGDVSAGSGPAVDLAVSRGFASWLGPAQWGPTTATATIGFGAGTRAAVASAGYTFLPLSTHCGN